MDHDELDRIAELLQECLGRIDGDAGTVLDGEEAADPDSVMSSLEGNTGDLRVLLHSLLGHLQGPLDLNTAVRDAVDGLLRQVEVPLVVNSILEDDLPPVAWPPEALHSSLRRALHLAASHAGPGGQISVTTRVEDGVVLFELTASGEGDERVRERGSTLEDFVEQMEGRCALQVDEFHVLFLVIEFRTAAQSRR